MKTHILLIDDDIEEMKIFVEALKAVIPPFTCTYASNGIHALQMLLYLRPEVIFVDYNMPGMNGLEFIEHLRKNDELHGIPLFLYSSKVSPQAVQRATQMGVTACIEKPASINDLVLALKDALAIHV
jgi:CheY-like chemotaxis protein